MNYKTLGRIKNYISIPILQTSDCNSIYVKKNPLQILKKMF